MFILTEIKKEKFKNLISQKRVFKFGTSVIDLCNEKAAFLPVGTVLKALRNDVYFIEFLVKKRILKEGITELKKETRMTIIKKNFFTKKDFRFCIFYGKIECVRKAWSVNHGIAASYAVCRYYNHKYSKTISSDSR